MDSEFLPKLMTTRLTPVSMDHMHALIDRSDNGISPRVAREAEFLLHDSFSIGVRAWKFMRSHEKDMWENREYDS